MNACLGERCMTVIPATRSFCQFCRRTLAIERAARETCECGGVNDSPMHEQSLLHRRYLWDRKYAGRWARDD